MVMTIVVVAVTIAATVVFAWRLAIMVVIVVTFLSVTDMAAVAGCWR